ncbi:MAG TPA: alpha/beta hydrolase [Chloroflexota bacterium]|nr:alpha/beta hydrolase [Chloroflexota bacterium]
MSIAEQTHIPSLDPTIDGFLQTLAAQGGPPLYTLSPAGARAVLAGVQAGEIKRYEADSEDCTINGGPTGEISLRIVRPRGISGPLPVVLYFHGGGWIMGDKETHDRLVREIATGAQATVVFVDYARSPEAHYPVAIEQAYAATKWVAENGATIKVDPSRLALAGDSVGGNMVAAVTLLAGERRGPRITFQVLFYPVTDAGFDTASYVQFAEGPWLTRKAMAWFWDSYAPNAAVRQEPTASPLQASLEQLQGLPPALIITDECDVLRDEGEAYAHRLLEAGVPVTATRYLGAIHDFVLLNPIAQSLPTRAAIAQATAALRAAFAYAPPR